MRWPRDAVIAHRRGSIPEVIEDGVTGFVVNRLEAATRAAGRISTLSRNHRRRLFEQRFHVSHGRRLSYSIPAAYR